MGEKCWWANLFYTFITEISPYTNSCETACFHHQGQLKWLYSKGLFIINGFDFWLTFIPQICQINAGSIWTGLLTLPKALKIIESLSKGTSRQINFALDQTFAHHPYNFSFVLIAEMKCMLFPVKARFNNGFDFHSTCVGSTLSKVPCCKGVKSVLAGSNFYPISIQYLSKIC